MKARFIFNPYSGHNRRNPHLRLRAAAFIQERGLDATVVDTLRPGHGTELAAAAVREGCGLVVAIGGDGTMNEVASALVDTPVLFGLIPCGSGNGLGRHVGIRRPDDGAFHTLLHGRPLPIDTGLVNGFPFFNAMGSAWRPISPCASAARPTAGSPATSALAGPLTLRAVPRPSPSTTARAPRASRPSRWR